MSKVKKRKRYFENQIADFMQSSILPGSRVLFVGCRDPHTLECLQPSYGVALVDESIDLEEARQKCPHLVFHQGRLNSSTSEQRFDYIILDDYLTYEDNLHEILAKLPEMLEPDGKVFIMAINPVLLIRLRIARLLRLSTPEIERNILALDDLENLASIFGYEILDSGYRFAIPFRLFGIGSALNGLLHRLPLLRRLCFGLFLVLRPMPSYPNRKRLSCSVVVPCYNEEDNVGECIKRIPDFGLWREIIVVNDGSRDHTEEVVRELMVGRDDIRFITYEKNGGKGYAVNEGWKIATGDVMMMLDCDMTTPPEELPIFHDAIERGAEFVNGTRIIYPREKRAIPSLNRLGVTFFALLISWIMQRRITDPFCGTKVFLRKYRQHFEIKEFLWGDWDLFFTAARFRMKMVEMPVHYKARKAGETKMKPFKHGVRLLKAAMKGLKVVQ